MSESSKVAIITGSSSGIGEATAKVFCQNGYHVVVTGSKPIKVHRVVSFLKQKYPESPEPLGIVADFQDPANVDTIVSQTIIKYGRIDVLVNNAGRYKIPPDEQLEDYDAYRKLMSINLDSTVKLSLLAAPHLRKTDGSVVNVASIAAIRPSESIYAYAASKSAMVMFGRCLAIDLAPYVRVNNVLPGPVVTEIGMAFNIPPNVIEMMGKSITVTRRSGSPDEIAELIYFLASDKASFITGADFVIDGGCSIKPLSLEKMMAGVTKVE